MAEINRSKETQVDVVQSLLEYDPETGVIIYKKRPQKKGRNNKHAGKAAGTSDGRYVTIGLMGRVHLAHRVIWAMQTGAWPIYHIDHINRDGLDNRWSNLREAKPTENQQNQTLRRNNTSGRKGVCWADRHSKWQASIRHGGRKLHLGLFSDLEDAAQAYAEAAIRLHGAFARVK